MDKTILIVLKPEYNIHLLLRRLESVVKSGDRIVFLLRSQLNIPTWLLAHVASLQTGFDNGITWQEQQALLSWNEQKAWAEKNLAEPARRALRRIGVKIEVDLYRHSLTPILKRYLNQYEIALILVATSSWLDRLKIVPIRVRNWLDRRLPRHPCFSLIGLEVKGNGLQRLILPNLGC